MSMVFRESSNGVFRVHALTFPMCFFNFSDLADHHYIVGPGGFHAVPRSSPITTKQSQTKQSQQYSLIQYERPRHFNGFTVHPIGMQTEASKFHPIGLGEGDRFYVHRPAAP